MRNFLKNLRDRAVVAGIAVASVVVAICLVMLQVFMILVSALILICTPLILVLGILLQVVFLMMTPFILLGQAIIAAIRGR